MLALELPRQSGPLGCHFDLYSFIFYGVALLRRGDS